MKLNINNRLGISEAISRAFPKGDIKQMVLSHDIKEKTRLKQEDFEKYNITPLPNGQIKWDDEKDTGIKVEFTEMEIEMIKEAFEELDKKKEMTTDLVETYKLFFNK